MRSAYRLVLHRTDLYTVAGGDYSKNFLTRHMGKNSLEGVLLISIEFKVIRVKIGDLLIEFRMCNKFKINLQLYSKGSLSVQIEKHIHPENDPMLRIQIDLCKMNNIIIVVLWIFNESPGRTVYLFVMEVSFRVHCGLMFTLDLLPEKDKAQTECSFCVLSSSRSFTPFQQTIRTSSSCWLIRQSDNRNDRQMGFSVLCWTKYVWVAALKHGS